MSSPLNNSRLQMKKQVGIGLAFLLLLPFLQGSTVAMSDSAIEKMFCIDSDKQDTDLLIKPLQKQATEICSGYNPNHLNVLTFLKCLNANQRLMYSVIRHDNELNCKQKVAAVKNLNVQFAAQWSNFQNTQINLDASKAKAMSKSAARI